MSGMHADLFSYHLKVGLLSEKLKIGELAPFNELYYLTVNTDSFEPCARLQFRRDNGSIVMDVFNRSKTYELILLMLNGELPDKLKAGLTSNPAFKMEANGSLSRLVERGMIGKAIDEAVNVVREFMSMDS